MLLLPSGRVCDWIKRVQEITIFNRTSIIAWYVHIYESSSNITLRSTVFGCIAPTGGHPNVIICKYNISPRLLTFSGTASPLYCFNGKGHSFTSFSKEMLASAHTALKSYTNYGLTPLRCLQQQWSSEGTYGPASVSTSKLFCYMYFTSQVAFSHILVFPINSTQTKFSTVYHLMDRCNAETIRLCILGYFTGSIVFYFCNLACVWSIQINMPA